MRVCVCVKGIGNSFHFTLYINKEWGMCIEFICVRVYLDGSPRLTIVFVIIIIIVLKFFFKRKYGFIIINIIINKQYEW